MAKHPPPPIPNEGDYGWRNDPSLTPKTKKLLDDIARIVVDAIPGMVIESEKPERDRDLPLVAIHCALAQILADANAKRWMVMMLGEPSIVVIPVGARPPGPLNN